MVRRVAGRQKQIAAEVGYESEAAFNRAFKKLIGTTPGHWRRRDRAGPEPRATVVGRHAVG